MTICARSRREEADHTIETPAYRVAHSPSLDLALPTHHIPGTPAAVLEADQALRGRCENCLERARDLAEARDAVDAAVEEDRHAAWQAAEQGQAETGNPAERHALEQLAGAERAAEGAQNAWKFAARRLALEYFRHRESWFDAIDAELQKIRERMSGQIDKLQAGFDRLEELQLLRAGLSEIPEPGGHTSGIRLNIGPQDYRLAERERVRDYTLEHGPGITTDTTVDSLCDALRWRVRGEATEHGRASW